MLKYKNKEDQERFKKQLILIRDILLGSRFLSIAQMDDLHDGICEGDWTAIMAFMVRMSHCSLITHTGSGNKKYRLVPKYHRSQLPTFIHERKRYVLVNDDGLGFCCIASTEEIDSLRTSIRDAQLPFALCINDLMYHPEDFTKKG